MDARIDAGLVASEALTFRGKRLTQYVSAPVFHSQNGERFNLAVEFLKGGRNVYDHAVDTPERWGGTAPPALVA